MNKIFYVLSLTVPLLSGCITQTFMKPNEAHYEFVVHNNLTQAQLKQEFTSTANVEVVTETLNSFILNSNATPTTQEAMAEAKALLVGTKTVPSVEPLTQVDCYLVPTSYQLDTYYWGSVLVPSGVDWCGRTVWCWRAQWILKKDVPPIPCDRNGVPLKKVTK